MTLLDAVPADWRAALRLTGREPAFMALDAFVTDDRARHEVYPPPADVFVALRLTSYESVRVVIIDQDPYHGPGQADGLAFSVRPGVRIPPSLRNILRDLERDLERPVVTDGSLVTWARRGVLLINAILTVRAGVAGSHEGRGWEQFTSMCTRCRRSSERTLLFLLWGMRAKELGPLIDESRHVVISSSHPSPLSA